jgi:hypothetical protein
MKTLISFAILAAGLHAADIDIYLSGDSVVPPPVSIAAKAEAVRIFARIDVGLKWRRGAVPAGRPSGPIAIEVRFTTRVPGRERPGALAYALPFNSQAVIVVMYDRIGNRAALLAHVLAHEIGHILRQTNVHDDTGIMKAHWTKADLQQMERQPLSFAPDAEESIRSRVNSSEF